MKFPSLVPCAAVACGLLLSGTFAAAADRVVINLDDQPAQPTPPAKAAPAAPKTAAKPATPSPTPAKTSKKEEPKIAGMAVARGERGYLGVAIKGGVFNISFYGKDKKPVPVDVSAAALRWPVHYQPNDERAYLTPSSDGKSLTSDRVVKPPYSFKLYITLLNATDDGQQTPVESYIIDFAQAEG